MVRVSTRRKVSVLKGNTLTLSFTLTLTFILTLTYLYPYPGKSNIPAVFTCYRSEYCVTRQTRVHANHDIFNCIVHSKVVPLPQWSTGIAKGMATFQKVSALHCTFTCAISFTLYTYSTLKMWVKVHCDALTQVYRMMGLIFSHNTITNNRMYVQWIQHL